MDEIIPAPLPYVGYYEDVSISCLAVATRRQPGWLFGRRGAALFRLLKRQSRLCELDPYLARDIGAAIGCDWRRDGSPIDSFPVWTPRRLL